MKFIRTVIAFWLVSCFAAQADITTFGSATASHIENMGEMSQNQRAGLEKFTSGAPYFGAFFIEKGGPGWGSFTGAHNITDAIEIARRICEKYASDGACSLSGIVYPREMDINDVPQATLSRRASEKHAVYLGRTDGFRAFATSRNTAFGWATRRETQQEAIEAALSNCWKSSMMNLLKLEVELRADALEDGLYDCGIIDLSGPDDPPS